MDVISNIIDEIDAMEYEEIVHKLVSGVIQEAENEIARELEKEVQTKEIAHRLLDELIRNAIYHEEMQYITKKCNISRRMHDDLIRDAIYHEESTRKDAVSRSRLMTNGSLYTNKSDTILLLPAQRNCVTIGIGSVNIQPTFTKSTLFETYAIKAQDKRSTPTLPSVTEAPRDHVHMSEVIKAEVKKEVDTDKKWQGLGNLVEKKSLKTRLRKFCTRLFGCCLTQNAD